MKCALCRFDMPPEAVGVDGKSLRKRYGDQELDFCCVGCAEAFDWEVKAANGDLNVLANELNYPSTTLKDHHVSHVPDESELMEHTWPDLKALAHLALKCGATDATIMRASDVVVDERAKFKCNVPKCRWYGASLMCPPFSSSPAEIRSVVDRFKHAVLMRIVGKQEHFTREGWAQRKHHKYFLRAINLVGKVESEAQAMGHYLAVGFACGHCRLCAEEINPKITCPAVKDGKADWSRCAYPLRARPAMESVGIDVFGTAKRAGWVSSYIGLTTKPSEVETAATYGIVFVC